MRAAFCLIVVCTAIGHVTAGPVVPPDPITELVQEGTDGCMTFLADGKGDFRIEKKRYSTRNAGFFIESVVLKERKSFYMCTPAAIKFGVSSDDKTWWVDKGCEGVFEITECPRRSANPRMGSDDNKQLTDRISVMGSSVEYVAAA